MKTTEQLRQVEREASPEIRWERWIISAMGLVLMVLFQNFTVADSDKVKNEIFGGKTSILAKKSGETRVLAARPNPLVEQAATYLSFIEGEDISKMSDGELVSRLRDGMLTNAEIIASDLEFEPSAELEAQRGQLIQMAQSLASNHELRQQVIWRARSMRL